MIPLSCFISIALLSSQVAGEDLFPDDQPQCNFDEGNMCGWYSPSERHWRVIGLNDIASQKDEYPPTDGSGNPDGKFLSVREEDKDPTAIAEAIIGQTGSGCLFSFKYFLPSTNFVSVYSMPQLYLIIARDSENIDTQRIQIPWPVDDKPTWHEYKVSLANSSEDSYIQFQADLSKTFNAYNPIGLDSLELIDCY